MEEIITIENNGFHNIFIVKQNFKTLENTTKKVTKAVIIFFILAQTTPLLVFFFVRENTLKIAIQCANAETCSMI